MSRIIPFFLLAAILLQCSRGGESNTSDSAEMGGDYREVSDWSGLYLSGDRVNDLSDLHLSEDGRYDYYSGGCWQSPVWEEGVWINEGPQIRFVPDKAEKVYLTTAHKVVRNDGIYLVWDRDLDDFDKDGPGYWNCYRRGESLSDVRRRQFLLSLDLESQEEGAIH